MELVILFLGLSILLYGITSRRGGMKYYMSFIGLLIIFLTMSTFLYRPSEKPSQGINLRKVLEVFMDFDEEGKINLKNHSCVAFDLGANTGDELKRLIHYHSKCYFIVFEALVEYQKAIWDNLGPARDRASVVTCAIGERTKLSTFYVSANSLSSSLLPYDPERYKTWPRNGVLKVEHPRVVVEVSFSELISLLPLGVLVEYTWLDVQGMDMRLLSSLPSNVLQERFVGIHHEVQLTNNKTGVLYSGAWKKEEAIHFMRKNGFVLISKHENAYEADLDWHNHRYPPTKRPLRPVEGIE